ncbi:DUF4179 domain-containing protein [Saccharibacillus alkalitolerans]|uniref:DUF4179 domain-containing protein n=1 Tax=Saccharibacillus alkalitolerans TaxID=2705290 RepID=A0ABX0F150_9BACL|nr:DUF4179 domain-containing protein [Saccharibacillus alkalitolerans]NGZ74707.1 DUF4179 domain-containing protein [Saccharibacillus alkalitolerans]
MNRSNAEQQLDLNLKNAGHSRRPISPLVRSRLDDAYASLPESPAAMQVPQQEAPRARKRSRAMRRTAAAAAAAFVLSTGLLASGFASPAMADTIRDIPVLGSLFSKIKGDAGLQTAGERNQGSLVEAAAESGDASMKVRETIFDGTRVAFAVDLTVPSIPNASKLEEKLQNVSLSVDGRTELNGFYYTEPEDQGGGTYTLLMNLPLQASDAKGLGDRFDGIISLKMANADRPLTVTVPFERIKAVQELHLKPGPSADDDTYALSIDTLDVTASTVRLGTTLALKDRQASAEKREAALLDTAFEIVDDQGRALDVVGGEGMLDGGSLTYVSNFGADLSEAKYIVVKPYIQKSEGFRDSKTYLEDLDIRIDLQSGKR